MTNDATRTQIRAARPDRSTWLTANAGSGKTRVLTDRVARLLLAGVDPANILCLTYTKAAAGEMQNRLFRTLGAWAMESDAALRDTLRAKGVEGDLSLPEARRLFARAIETPGGLKIQTIHSFCASILRRFPMEAGISPQFTEMDDRTGERLRAEILDEMALDDPARILDVARHLSGDSFDGLVKLVMAQGDALCDPFPDEALRRFLGAHEAAPDLRARLSGLGAFAARAVPILENGSSTEKPAARRLRALIGKAQPDHADMAAVFATFLTGANTKTPFASKAGGFPTKSTRATHPEIASEFDDIADVVAELHSDYRAALALDRCRALYAFAQGYVPRVRARMQAAGYLGFDDLITRCRDLLRNRVVADWVLWRLDGGIDHILVDEAQDTSPEQWAVIQSLAAEIAAGQGSHDDRPRTLFVVGDRKQSIYSFQGADPDEFDRMQAHFDTRLSEGSAKMEQEVLAYSFRSAPQILAVVDRVFAGDRAEGLESHVAHRAFKQDMPGRVDLWDPIPEPDKDDAKPDWTDPTDRVQPRSARGQLARRVAANVARMIGTETLPAEDDDGNLIRRPVRAGDVLILVRGRQDGLFAALLRALKSEGVPVAGADRLKLQGEMAVRDLVALLRFVALPDDDLSLATALRSPLLGWSERDLFHLAQPRKGHLWQSLRETGSAAAKMLSDLLARADYLRPYDLISRILIRYDGRARLLARLGPECEEGIDALLAQALVFEQAQVPGLTGFLTWLEAEDVEIKRQMGEAANAVRVMTVHGSKGLEAPIVILPDARKKRDTPRGGLLAAGDLLIWPGRKDERPAPVQDLADAAQMRERLESRRLLYVAMTRAEKWLIVAAVGETGAGTESWHAMVRDAMEDAAPLADPPGLRIEGAGWSAVPLHSPDDAAPAQIACDIPDPITPVAANPVPLSPSDLGGAKALPGEGRADALTRGTILHKLLETLPQVPAPARPALARRIVTPEGGQDDLIDTALRLIETPALAEIFAPGGLSEVDLSAYPVALGGRQMIGAIDRLIVTPERVLAVDFKSNHRVPARTEDVPEGILRQMGAYAAALDQIFPSHQIDTAILWTKTASLMALPPALTQAALNRAGLA